MDHASLSDPHLIPLSTLIPGWKGQYIPSYVADVTHGLGLEQVRLQGSQLLVVLRLRELSYDGIREKIRIVSGHRELKDAARVAKDAALRWLAQRSSEVRPYGCWRPMQDQQSWPSAATLWESVPLSSYLAGPWDGTGYCAIEVAAAILPTAPADPINPALIQQIDMHELADWFADVGRAAQTTPSA
ncbi:hypothetical protein [Stenotrophomonas sp. YAU14A_MKIMI4_1]|uniref:hypothetical protein n=1 Tax=Stenotrophomonas sp. YAU14A_MKIMI4_1 TaxID=2072408 RepID=UPI000D53D324|nr:hypothetical protein [Stenotrophomonas sp. YAU14A_MKIMI4_1]AWH29823.1 hypothetical protein C1931_13375 [Stenotrophomonas sp. YAU14A_MKIMI4_1]